MLLERDADPVVLSVMSAIRTIQGEEHETEGFHDPEPMGNCGVGLADRPFVADIMDERKIPDNKTTTALALRTRRLTAYDPWRDLPESGFLIRTSSF